jgi:fatty acid desaturase
MDNHALEQKYRVEIARLDAEHADYERLWKQVPRFALITLLAPIAGFYWGWAAAVVALLVWAALVGTRAYLIAVRRTENRWNRDKLIEDLQERVTPPLHAQAA